MISEAMLIPPSALTMQQIYEILPGTTKFLSEEVKKPSYPYDSSCS